jgi:uncharacterized protein
MSLSLAIKKRELMGVRAPDGAASSGPAFRLEICVQYGIMHRLMKDVDVLVRAGCSPDVIAHCEKVSAKASELAAKATVSMDRELVRQGGLLHDIGRSSTHGIEHALVGAVIAKRLGFSDQLVNIIERHIGAGITASEAARLGLPPKDYLPLSREEKIVSYADNLISGTREMPFHEALDRFKKILGSNHEGVELFVQQYHQIQGWMK